MNSLKPKLKYFIVAIVIIAVDLCSKHYANTHLNFAQPYKITSFFNLTLLYNHGAAFSFLSNDQTSWQLIMFACISMIAAIILIYLIIKQPITAKLNLFSFAMILGGALGNFYDRAFRGFVIDFLDFHIDSYHWPAFNIADSAITCGVILLILSSFFTKKP
ncbi:signal peptidase II [Francisella adeliensis]|uniref:Lipoprotein signal peptidase n=1 Tax=Francisella adeliensis TaxID=2007306 RepID=A0A2Z4Y168_9GAMM|nr:signal peptidase II [Francisella adeliensis]AXA34472.1 signal peptidase II [Francisella adeliensis]MBK2086191.1 lipoprotein signal peptidase [Francisella adeliensis]MBK2096408.1 lipoprotein signal peptidase [Francisella adeliensis]QIW12719.1 signal peptidase II [Francisella adeliensis]QIW14595.1 signal peptidase II [Francisella adeliensis]